MKHLLFGLACLFFSQNLTAQDQRLFWKYKEYDGAIAFAVPSFLPKIASIFVKGKEERRLIRRTGKIRVMFFENENPISQQEIAKISGSNRKNGLADLLTVRDGKTNVKILVKENGRRIRKLVVLVQDEGEFVLVSVKGRFKYSDINRIIKKSQEKTDKKSGKKSPLPDNLPVKIPLKIPVSVKRTEI